MATLLDKISDGQAARRMSVYAENAADTLLTPARAWGFGRQFTVVSSGSAFYVKSERHRYSTALKVAAAVFFPLAALAFVFGLTLKMVLRETSPEIKRKYAIPVLHKPASATAAKALVYPEAKRIEHCDHYHGEKIYDPYRWLEDASSPERKEWIAQQISLAKAYLDSLPGREEIAERMEQLWNYEKFGLPFKEGGRYFWFKNDGMQNQSVLYTAKSLDEEPVLLIDPNTLSADGTTSLADCSPSEDGKWLLYAISEGGSDWQTIKVRHIETGKDLEDTIQWVKFSSLVWTKDSLGFFYSRYDEPSKEEELQASNKGHKLYYHRLGKPQEEDELVYSRPDKEDLLFQAAVSEDGTYLIVNVEEGCRDENDVLIKKLNTSETTLKKLFDHFEASYSYVGNIGNIFYFLTNKDAPNKKLIAVNIEAPEEREEIVPEGDDFISSAGIVGNQLVLKYIRDAHTEVKIFTLNGTPVRDVALPGIGDVHGFNGKRTDGETFYGFTGFTAPNAVYRYDMKTGESKVFRSSKVDFNPEDYTTKQVFFKSKDGTKVPLFIIHKKGIELDGENRTILYGYGGFNVSILPAFSVPNLVWMERGGVLAVANLRGGGEYGKAWHEAGMKQNKQNVFDDFIAAGEWLINEGYTKSSKLAIRGGSNGGLLVGACVNQRPDLFGAAMPMVGVMDMLRFNQFTIGKAWESDYGSPQNAAEFQVLKQYSPYHNIDAEISYPAIMVTTSDHDDRVVPLHSYKYTAQMQWAKKTFDDKPAIVRIATNTGHGAGRSTKERINEAVEQWLFLENNLK